MVGATITHHFRPLETSIREHLLGWSHPIIAKKKRNIQNVRQHRHMEWKFFVLISSLHCPLHQRMFPRNLRGVVPLIEHV
jgi:hypothetical protein